MCIYAKFQWWYETVLYFPLSSPLLILSPPKLDIDVVFLSSVAPFFFLPHNPHVFVFDFLMFMPPAPPTPWVLLLLLLAVIYAQPIGDSCSVSWVHLVFPLAELVGVRSGDSWKAGLYDSTVHDLSTVQSIL